MYVVGKSRTDRTSGRAASGGSNGAISGIYVLSYFLSDALILMQTFPSWCPNSSEHLPTSQPKKPNVYEYTYSLTHLGLRLAFPEMLA